jgi:hypothetical protein
MDVLSMAALSRVETARPDPNFPPICAVVAFMAATSTVAMIAAVARTLCIWFTVPPLRPGGRLRSRPSAWRQGGFSGGVPFVGRRPFLCAVT